MDRVMFSVFDEIETPAYVVDETALIRNLEILKEVKEKSGAKILLAQKAFSMFSLYPLIMEYLDGTTSSGLYEARLAHEEAHGQVHVYCPAYKEDEIGKLAGMADHIIFNSKKQLIKFKDKCRGVSLGLRINPEYSTQDTPIYDPCAPGSRLGVTFDNFDEGLVDHIEGFHIHTLCEQDAYDLKVTLDAFLGKFGKYLGRLKWLNLGGGHHITREGYDRELLISLVKDIRDRYGLEVYLEPGEAVALNAGYLVCEVMDIVRNDFDIAILDASAACHMPDVLEMPYRPPLYGASYPSEKPYTYRLAGRTCLAGDFIGDYSFDDPLRVGDKLCFMDMAIYSMVKNNTFNGMPLPDICVLKRDGSVKVIKKFGYDDFKGRLS